MVSVAHTVLALLVVFLEHVLSQSVNTSESCAVLYERGVEAYLENDYEGCVAHLEAALEGYRRYARELRNCRLKCAQEADRTEPLFPKDVEDLHFYEKAVRNTLCVLKCKTDRNIFGSYNLNKETEELFERRKPYEYLHICYYQTDRAQKAASAVFTYLAENPKDSTTLANLKFYSSLPDVDMTEVVNFEAKDYVYHYIHGADAYAKKDWRNVVDYMEESLQDYLEAENGCRASCEGPFDQGWFPDLIPSIANHFTYCLRCKTNCKRKLGNLNGEFYDDLIASHYHYLQIAYFKSGNLKAACECVASYLLFYPMDETMIYNKEYYSKLPKFQSDYFAPRQEAVYYVRRQMYEERLLEFVDKNFTAERIVKDVYKKDEPSTA